MGSQSPCLTCLRVTPCLPLCIMVVTQASSHDAPFFCHEMCEQIREGHMLVLPWSQAQHIPGLTLTPPGLIPQPGRRPRPIFDYTWSGINNSIHPRVPPKAMQFGQAF
eukprot:8527281-Ditylum_brightwellii.AAC.1